MAAKNNPQDKATGDVEKAYRDLEKASKKVDDLQSKLDDAEATRARADRTLIWAASHPDLPEDFSLEDFVEELREPFKGDDEDDKTEPATDADDLQVAAVASARTDLDEGQEEKAEANFVEGDSDPFSDDVFGDVGEPEEKPAPRSRRSR